MIKGQALSAKGQALKVARLKCLPLKGFTLVEVLVTMVILALLGLGAASVVQSMTRSKEQSEQSIEQLAQLQYFMLTLEQDVRSIVARPNATGQLLYFNRGQLAFVRSGWFNPGGMLPRSTLQPVAYIVRDNTLVREYFPYVDVSPGEEPVVQTVLDGVTDMQVRFYYVPSAGEQASNTAATAAKGSWSGSWERPEELPHAIEITLATERWGELRRVFLLTGGSFTEQAPVQRDDTVDPPPAPDGGGAPGGGNG